MTMRIAGPGVAFDQAHSKLPKQKGLKTLTLRRAIFRVGRPGDGWAHCLIDPSGAQAASLCYDALASSITSSQTSA